MCSTVWMIAFTSSSVKEPTGQSQQSFGLCIIGLCILCICMIPFILAQNDSLIQYDREGVSSILPYKLIDICIVTDVLCEWPSMKGDY